MSLYARLQYWADGCEYADLCEPIKALAATIKEVDTRPFETTGAPVSIYDVHEMLLDEEARLQKKLAHQRRRDSHATEKQLKAVQRVLRKVEAVLEPLESGITTDATDAESDGW